VSAARKGERRGEEKALMPRGRLTIFSAAERRYCEPLLRGFAREHPEIAVDFVFGISTDLHRRFVREAAAGEPTADLLWSSAMDQQMELVFQGHAQPHGLPLRLPADFAHRGLAYQDLAVATTCEPLFTLSRDPAARAGTPGEIAALIAQDPPRYRGRIVVPDIEANGLGFLAMLSWALDDPAFDDFLAMLCSCAPRTVGSAPALIAAMAEGAVLALHLLGSYAKRAVADDPTLHIAPSTAPTLAVSRIAFIPRRAANPEAASWFLAFMLSPPGQAALGEAGLFPLTATPATRLAPIPLDEGFSRLLDEPARARLLTRWRTAVGRTEPQHRRKHA
jgi:iron(III) transport system substrate-binding protein